MNLRDDDTITGRRDEMLSFIRAHDPEGAEKLSKLGEKEAILAKGNVYGERFTSRQFALVFDPLLTRAFERSQILEHLVKEKASVPGLAQALKLPSNIVFDHVKELLRRDLIEIAGYEERDAIYRRKSPGT